MLPNRNYMFAANMLYINSTIPANKSEINITLSTKHYNYYIIRNIIGDSFCSWKNISEKYNNNKFKIYTKKNIFKDCEIKTGVLHWLDDYISITPPQNYQYTVIGQCENFIPKNINYISFGDNFEYYENPFKENSLGLNQSNKFVLNEHLELLENNFLTINITQKYADAASTKISSLITNEIENASGSSRIIWSPYKDMFIRTCFHTSNFDDLNPESYLNLRFAQACKYTNENSEFAVEGGKQMWYYVNYTGNLLTIDDFEINCEFESNQDIVVEKSFMAFYDSNKKFLFTIQPYFNDNIAVFNYKDQEKANLAKNFVIQFYSGANLITNPEFLTKIKSIYTNINEIIIKLEDGLYSSYDSLINLIYKPIIDSFKQNFDITMTIDVSKLNALVNIKADKPEVDKIIEFFGENELSSGRFLGVYDKNLISFNNEYKSNNEADLYSDDRFNFLQISLPQLSSSGFFYESTNILSYPVQDVYSKQIITSNIMLSKNFPENCTLHILKLNVRDNKNQIILNNSPIRISFIIDCYDRVGLIE